MVNLFRLHLPTRQPIPMIANLPHSGLLIPSEVAAQLDPIHQQFLPNQDWHLDQLYDFLPDLGITALQAVYSRYVVDLNRSPHPPLFGNFWQSAIAEKTALNTALYQTPPDQPAIQQRMERYYYPYHDQLQALLNESCDRFGKVYLLDLHSFLGLIDDDICLGNANGRTCSEQFITIVADAFQAKGYQVVRNKVFSGGYITRHYGQMPQVEALQIEVRYPVYLDKTQLELAVIPNWEGAAFSRAKQQFETIFRQIVAALSQAEAVF